MQNGNNILPFELKCQLKSCFKIFFDFSPNKIHTCLNIFNIQHYIHGTKHKIQLFYWKCNREKPRKRNILRSGRYCRISVCENTSQISLFSDLQFFALVHKNLNRDTRETVLALFCLLMCTLNDKLVFLSFFSFLGK